MGDRGSRTWHLTAAALAWTACSGGGGDGASSTGAPGSAALASSPAPASSAAPSAAAIASHAPGTVPTSAPRPEPPHGPPADDRLPPVAPRIEHGATSLGKRKGSKGLTKTTWLDDARVALEYGGRLEILDVEKGATTVLVTGSRVTSFAARGATVATLDESNRVVLWDLDDKSPPRAWTALADFTGTAWDADAAVVLSPKGDRVAFSSGGDLVAWDTATGKELAHPKADGTGWYLAVTSTEVGFAVNASSYHAWSLEGGKETGSGSFETGATFNVSISPDLKWAAGSAPAGHGMQVSAVHGPQSVRTLVGDTDCGHHISVSFSRDSRYLYAHLGPDRVKGFETETWKPYASYASQSERAISSMADDLGRVVTTKEHQDPAVVDVATRKETPLEAPLAPAVDYAYEINGAGTMIVGNDAAGLVRVWSARATPTAQGRTRTGSVIYEISPE